VIRTFVNLVPITIPTVGPASPYPSTIQVGGLRAGEILDVNVTLSGLSNDWSRYFEVVLVAPGGLRTVVLMNDVGGLHDIADVTLVFDDQAASFLPHNDRIVSGTYKPTAPGVAPVPDTAPLRSFNGLNPNGSWRLYVADSTVASAGNIAGWALTITARVRV
jgi:subtilisin-like proprotein convertase family protein